MGQLAARTELNASTLRYQESVGLLPAPEQIAQQTGFSIQEITVL
ncbi:hypothetical protein [Paenibacillus sp. yr247]|nr:hypothetical protein [Paenibacillus sp. yr247]